MRPFGVDLYLETDVECQLLELIPKMGLETCLVVLGLELKTEDSAMGLTTMIETMRFLGGNEHTTERNSTPETRISRICG